MNEQSLFHQALEQPAGEPRRNWLEQECADPNQRQRIVALLERHEKAGCFLETPPEELSGRNLVGSLAKAKLIPITKSKFVDRLIRSKLMTAEDVAECEAALESVRVASDAQAYALAMVKANKLTGFQAKAIYEGRIKGLKFGEYIILDQLGKGGMGIVYKAKHRRMDRLVAIKVLPRSAMATKGLEDRFYREVKTAAKLMHPNIVAALDAGEDDGLHYLVMEYVDGQDLRKVLRQSGPLQPDHAVHCILQAARGLQYAHEQGVIHRDIKPANLLIDGNGTVKILDMGLARVAGDTLEPCAGFNSEIVNADKMESSYDSPVALSWTQDTAAINEETRLTQAGDIMGTLDYMPPEQFTDTRNVDERGDIYSLGCTLYRLLTDQRPFSADTAGAIFEAHRDAPVPTLRSIRPDISEHLDQVFQRMMAKEPDQRQNSMSQVIAELEESLIELRSPQVNSAEVAAASYPPVVLSRNEPIRRRRSRNQMRWVPVWVLAGALLVIGALMWVPSLGNVEKEFALSGKTKVTGTTPDIPQQNRRATPHTEPNKNAMLATNGANEVAKNGANEVANGAKEVVSGTSHLQENAEDQNPAVPLDEITSKAEAEKAELPQTGGTITEVLPRVSEKGPPKNDSQAEQPRDRDFRTNAGKPMNWIGNTTWSGGFEFQGVPTFSPSANRHVEFFDNGRRISITETGTGITVVVDGRVVEAANPAELKKKDAQAYAIYHKTFNTTDVGKMPTSSAVELQRMQLEKLREMHSGNPQLQSLIEKMLGNDRK